MKDDRRVLTDVTFDAPKSVSLALEMGGLMVQGDTRVLPVMQDALRNDGGDRTCVQTRVRKNRLIRIGLTGNMVSGS